MFESDVGSYMTIEHEFWGVRFLDDKVHPAQWKLIANIVGLEDETVEDQEKHRQELIATYQKLQYWLDYFMTDALFIPHDNIDAIESLSCLAKENTIVTMPVDTADATIVKVLHSKITSLINSNMMVGTVSLKATDTNSTFYYSNCDGEYALPLINYIGEDPSHKVPWWERDDLDTYDVDLSSIEDDEQKEECRSSLDTAAVMREIVSDIRRSLGIANDEPEEPKGPANIIKLNTDKTWTPKTV